MFIPRFTVISVGEVHPLWEPGMVDTTAPAPSCGHLMLSLQEPSATELHQFESSGRGGFRIYENIVVLVVDWPFLQVTMPYHDNIIGDFEPFERTTEGEHRLLTFALVDSRSGNVLKLRASTLSRHVSVEMQRRFDSHRSNPILPEEFATAASRFDSQGWSRREILRRATMCRLGD